MKIDLEFYDDIEKLESTNNYKELFKMSLKCSQSTSIQLAKAATRTLSMFRIYHHISIDKQIEYTVKDIYLDDNPISKSSAISNLAICYRFKGDWLAYQYFLEKALAAGETDAALELAKFYIISEKTKGQVKKLLKQVVKDQYTYEVSREEAQQLLEDIKYNKINDKNYLEIKAAYNNKKLPSKAFIEMTEELQNSLLEAITNYELSDYKKSFPQLRKLANIYRNSTAMIYLGDSYLYGQGTIVDYGKAALYYHEAEKTNQIEAILKLADFYKAVREFSLYKHYLQKARLQGSDKATLLLAKLYAIIPKENHYVKELLTELLASSTATMDIIFEAEQMYAQLSLIKLTKK